MATAMLVQAKLPPSFWQYATETAVYLRIRLLTKASLTESTPLHAAYPNIKEDQYSHLQPFGCLCYVLVPEEKQESFTTKTRICIFLGYVWNSTKLYKVMDVATRHVFTTVSIKFDDQQFPGIPALPGDPSNPNISPYDISSTSSNQPTSSHQPTVGKRPSDLNSKSPSNPTKKPRSNRKRSIGNKRNEIQLHEVLDSNSTQATTNGIKKSGIPNQCSKVPADISLQSKEVPASNSPSTATVHTVKAACGHTVSIVNLVCGLTYFDLVEDELSASLIRDTPILKSPWPTVLLTAQSHGGRSSGGGAGSIVAANIRVDVNGDPLDFMRQNYTDWNPAVKAEIKSQVQNGTFDITFLPPEKTAIGCRWVFKRKEEIVPVEEDQDQNQADGSRRRQERNMETKIRIRHKARLVAKGYEQEHGVDFWATFSPTPRITTLRILIALTAYFGWDIHQLDVETAFLNADLDTEVYMKIPQGMEELIHKWLQSQGLNPNGDLGGRKPVLRLRKSLYGLKQSPREWNKDIDSKLKELGFRQCDADPNLYIPTFENGCFLLLYVDDILLVGTPDSIVNVKNMIKPLYKMKDCGLATLFLGIRIERLPDGRIKLSQTHYIEKLLERFGMKYCNPTHLPMKRELRKSDNNNDDLHPNEITEYQALVGGLNWVAIITRPDISYTLSRLAKFMSKPSKIHLEAAKQALRFLAGTKDIGLIFGTKPPEARLIGYTDSNFAADEDNRRSTSGFLFKLNGACVHWQSKQQSLIARSTHEAEYVAMAAASYEVSYLRKLFANLTATPLTDLEPTLLYGDNMGAIATATNPDGDKTPRTRHIDIRYHITREALANGTLRLKYVRTTDMTADILTKVLPIQTYRHHMKNMGLGR